MMTKLPGSANDSYNEKVDEYNSLVERMDRFRKKNFLYRLIFRGRYMSMRAHLAVICPPSYWND
ncbi:hypothetical protein [Serratia sp. Se-RSBMAAmG]|uniref:hypothetical protein n=1 Tax=Serratia sp. Se-RSBMAAmG TaxID=3043305 RepID=UPI0024AEBAFF|nr:hypothetical protein [Serratia sp. Se-RSBMAAmG]MDI6976055.1 hypothetical protein [Serratia sp. Se-RSBMAAmG]